MSKKNQNFEDKRRFKRVEMGSHRLKATLAVIDKNQTIGCLVPVKDFSKSGAGCYLKFQVVPQTTVKLSIEGLDFAPIDGVVVWVAPSSEEQDPLAPPTHPFRVGIDFRPSDKVAEKNQADVFEYIRKLAEK